MEQSSKPAVVDDCCQAYCVRWGEPGPTFHRLSEPEAERLRDALDPAVPPPPHDSEVELPMTGMTLQEARTKLTGWHFAKEALSQGERDVLYVAEGLLRLLDERT